MCYDLCFEELTLAISIANAYGNAGKQIEGESVAGDFFFRKVLWPTVMSVRFPLDRAKS